MLSYIQFDCQTNNTVDVCGDAMCKFVQLETQLEAATDAAKYSLGCNLQNTVLVPETGN